jgi:hypothetical protein
MTVEPPTGITMKRLAHLFGLTTSGIYVAIGNARFPIPTYRLGKGRYADRQAVRNYFEAKRSEGLAALTRSGELK